MKIYRTRFIIQLLFFLLLIYGAYVGLRLPNITPLWRCPHQNSYSEGCYLLPFHRIQYGYSVYPQENRGMPFPGYMVMWGKGAYLRFFLFLIIAVFIFNKIWCGWACPFGTLQDFIHYVKRKFKLQEILFSQRIKDLIRPLKYIFLVFFLGALILLALGYPVSGPLFCKICPAKTLLQPFEGNLLNLSLQFPHDTLDSVITCIISGFILAALIFKRRFFCFVCPIKAFINLFNIRLFWHLRKNPDSCNFCLRCEQVCPMETKGVCLEKKAKTIFSKDCIFCLRCIDECPKKGVLKATIFKERV